VKPISKSDGVNASEKFLAEIAETTFLSLWSYPNVFRQPGTELADLVAVCGSDIIVFSDKEVGWASEKEIGVAWARWYKKAVEAGAKSVVGSAKWIREQPHRMFLDAANREPFPLDISEIANPRFHLISVSTGVEGVIKKYYGDRSGTFMLTAHILGKDHLSKAGTDGHPYFALGDILPEKDFVHVFSRSGLACVMREFDTITDFLCYLSWRKAGFRQKKLAFAAGEEELVAVYWGQMKDIGWDFSKVYGKWARGRSLTAVGGLYREMSIEPDYLEWRMACEKSDLWDKIVYEFSKHVISGKVPKVADFIPSFETSERVLRFLALENRERRIILSTALSGMMEKSINQKADRFVRKFPMIKTGDKHGYVFMVSTYHPEVHGSYQEYRDERSYVVGAYCLDLLNQFPNHEHVVGIAMDTAPTVSGRTDRSEDVMVVERPEFDDELLSYLEVARDELEMTPVDAQETMSNLKQIEGKRDRGSKRNLARRRKAFRV
jgi:hypothetical protein